MLCAIAGAALGGMMANDTWMTFAKEQAREPGNGDVPDTFARIAALYAERTLAALEERDADVKTWLNSDSTT